MTFTLRLAHEQDVPALAALHVQAFNETHRGGRSGGPSYELREHQWRDRFSRYDGSWFCYVVEDHDGTLVGFAMGAPHDGETPEYEGELSSIYLLQRVQRRGVVRRRAAPHRQGRIPWGVRLARPAPARRTVRRVNARVPRIRTLRKSLCRVLYQVAN